MSKAEDVLRALAGDVGVGAATTVPSLPASPSTGDATLDQFLSALKQTVETWSGIRGDSLDATVTWRDLINKQFAKIDVSSGNPANQLAGIKPTAAASEIDYTPPAAPTGLVATGALSTIILDWDAPTYKNHAYTEIWRSSTNNIGTAEKIGMSPGAVYADSVGGGFTYYYWIRFVSLANVVGAYNLTDGTAGTTSSNPDYVLDLLSGQITESELATGLNTRINLIDAPATTNGSVAARIKAETDARTDADTALTNSITTLQSTVTANNQTLTAAVQQEASTRANADGALEAQYTVKLDVNGYVSGFGLASTLNNATPFSNFIFKADQFAFGAPGLTTAYPFVIQATATTVNGVDVPAGVYIDAAYIKNGTLTNAKIGNAAIDSAKIADAAIVTAKIGDAQITTAKIADAQITNAKINDLSAEKINAGTISADRIGANSITAGKIDTRGLTIKDDAGNIVFAAASGLDWSLINGSNKPADGATKNTIYRQDTAPTSGMSVNDVWFDTTNSATYYYSGSAWVLAGDKTASNTAAAIANQGAFATLNQIDSTNVSTYIANAAIQNAQIGNVIQSNIYISGQSGWRIDKTGNMELNSAVFRGSLDVKSASSGARMQVTNSQIAVFDSGGALRVLIGNLG